MGVLDKFLNAMKLHDDDGFDDDDFLDDEIEEDYEEPRPKKRLFKKLEEEEDYDGFGYEDSAPARQERKAKSQSKSTRSGSAGSSKISPMRPRKTNSGMEVCVIKPRSMEDAREITETLLSNCTVVLNMEGLDVDVAQRIIDFSSGSCYAINGNLQKISSYIFIITPASVDISGDFQEILNGAFDIPSIHTNF